jgi:hypothetical protein
MSCLSRKGEMLCSHMGEGTAPRHERDAGSSRRSVGACVFVFHSVCIVRVVAS